GRADQLLGHLDMQRVNILEERGDILVGVFADANPRSGRRLDDAVVHIGYVHYLKHAQALRAQKPTQDILKHERAEVSYMRRGVDRGPASVDAHLAGVNRIERLQAVSHRIVQAYLDHICAMRKTMIVSDASPRSKLSTVLFLRFFGEF